MKKEQETKENVHQMPNPPKEDKKGKTVIIVIGALLVTAIAILGFLYYNGTFDDLGSSEEDRFNENLIAKLRALMIADPNCDLDETSSTEAYIDDFLSEGCRFDPGVEIAKIGGEVITTDDFNNYIFTFDQATYFDSSELTDEELLAIYTELKEDSIKIQEYNDEFNEKEGAKFTDKQRNPNSYQNRNEAIENIENSYNREYGEYIQGEILTIWFHNMIEPIEGRDAAMLTARRVMHYYKDRINQDGMTFRQAANEIVQREELRVLDFSIDTNVYSSFESSDGTDIFNDDSLEKALINLGEGHVSDVILVYDNSPDEGRIPAYYALLHVTERSSGGSSLDEELDNSSINENIEVL